MSDEKKAVAAFFFFPRPQVFGDWTVALTLSAPSPQPRSPPQPVTPRVSR